MNVELTELQKRIIEHSLGVAYRPKRFKPYRNFYSISPGCTNFDVLRQMEADGLLTSNPDPFGGKSVVFHVTETGAKAIGRKLPKEQQP